MATDVVPTGAVAHTRPPAKLNLFLELLARRDDGYHEIDTVMVPVDWCDHLRLTRTPDLPIKLNVGWLPSRKVVADRLGVEPTDPLLLIPEDQSNLVHQALQRFRESFNVEGGFQCELAKSIPAGAGMGGASSDAASSLRCAAALCGIPADAPELVEIAASIGSDVPFFLGGIPSDVAGDNPITAARARGRGERLDVIRMMTSLYFVVVYPGVGLSTGKVYADSRVPQDSQSASRLIASLQRGDVGELDGEMFNRLSEAAKKLAPQIDEIIESLWRMGLRTCQLTGSGSACFAIASSPSEAKRIAAKVRAVLEPGAIVMATRSASVPAPVTMT